MEQISVTTSSNRYPVTIGRGILSDELPKAVGVLAPKRVAVIADSNVAALGHPSRVTACLPGEVHCHVFPAGEGSKNLATIAEMLAFLADNHFTRSDLVIALGGGVTGDMAGFTAAIYLRGCRVLQIPTTLLAAIDSSVGGKTGVDLPQGKNLVGAFWQPSAVLCDTELLDTLPQRILFDGVAEAIKYGVIKDAALFEELSAGPEALRSHLESVIARCVAIKAAVVAADEFDRGDRALLNFGHTIGHAVEKCSNFTISHGQAVGIGMVRMTQIAEKNGWCPAGIADRTAAALRKYDLPTAIPQAFAAEELVEAMLHDKKRAGDTLTIVVPRVLGECVRRELPVSELRKSLELC